MLDELPEQGLVGHQLFAARLRSVMFSICATK